MRAAQAAALKEQVAYFQLPGDGRTPRPARVVSGHIPSLGNLSRSTLADAHKGNGQTSPHGRRERGYVRF